MRKLILCMFLVVTAANANEIKTIAKCQDKKTQILYQVIGTEERLLLLRGKSAQSYLNCEKNVSPSALRFKCQGEEFASDISFSYNSEKQTAVLTHGLFKFRKHLKCQ